MVDPIFVGDNDHGDMIPPTPTVESLIKQLQDVRYERDCLLSTVNKIRSNPYYWWVRQNLDTQMIDMNFSVTYEFLDDITQAEGENTVKFLSDKIAAEILQKHKSNQALNRLSELDEELGLND